MLDRKLLVNPPSITPPLKPYYANGVVVAPGPLMFISGQVSIDANGDTVAPGDLRGQAIQTLENIKAILEEHGGKMSDIVKVTVYVTNMCAYHDLTEIRVRYFGESPPASTIIQVVALADPSWMVEIDAVAAIG
jgi:2-iminobutanoate/2-iminopropanoate deaminase